MNKDSVVTANQDSDQLVVFQIGDRGELIDIGLQGLVSRPSCVKIARF